MNYSLVELRCYEKSSKGIEISDRLSYAFVEKVGDYSNIEYQNIFTDEVYPVVKRANVGREISYYFEEDTSKIFSKYGEVGLCWVLTNIHVSGLPLETVKNIVIYSDYYYKDRKLLMDELFESDFNSSMRKTYNDDLRRYSKLVDYLDEKGIDLEGHGKKLIR